MQRGVVVVVGTVNLDLVFAVERLPAANETVGGATYTEIGGGKGANTAAAAATGATTSLIAAVGDDAAGAAALDELETLQVRCDHVEVIAGVPTGRAAIVTGSDGNQIAVAPGANAALSLAHIERSIDALAGVHPRAVCLVSGELDDAAMVTAITTASNAGWRVLVNLSPARPLPADAAACRPWLMVNEIEAEQLTGVSDPTRMASALLDRTDVAVVTLGPDGVSAASRATGEFRRPALAADVVDTVGAGDACCGAFGAALASGAELAAALDAGLAASAAAVAAPGARGWLTRLSRLSRLSPELGAITPAAQE